MSLPDYGSTEYGLLRLLGNAPSGAMHCQDVYRLLACEFPQLTREDTSSPYRRSLSRWANHVQFARLHLVLRLELLPCSLSGRGIWIISERGRRALEKFDEHIEKLLADFAGDVHRS